MLKDLLKKGDYMVKIDLKGRRISDSPKIPDHLKYLRFLWRDSFLEFACLPFGLASAPRVFTKLLKPVLSILRQGGIRLIVYLDNILFYGGLSGAGPSACCFDSKSSRSARLYSELPNVGTSSFRKMEFSGSLVNSLDLSRSLPRDKIRKVQSKCQDLLNTPVTTVRELSVKLPGILSSSIQAVFPPPSTIGTSNKRKTLSSDFANLTKLQSIQTRSACSPFRLGVPPRGIVVERLSSSMEWESPVPTIKRLGHRGRCLTSRLGSLL